jgi:ribosomal protein L37AE/L43A
MSINRVQFQKGLSMAEFFERYGTEDKCHAALVAQRWPDGFICPDCGGTQHCSFVREGRQYWQCRACRTQFTVTCGTVFQATKLPLTRWFLAMHLMTQSKNNVSALELKRHLGVRYKAAWLMKHKLLQVMTEREASRVLDGRVEIDDAYLGGEREGKRGRGSENKVSFVVAVQTTEDGRPVALRMDPVVFTNVALADWALKALSTSACVISDGLQCFAATIVQAASHTPIVVGSGRQSAERAEFRCVNTVISNVKTAISGTYHSFKVDKYIRRYLAEAQYRFNRRYDLKAILTRLLHAATLTGPRPERVIRAAELGG